MLDYIWNMLDDAGLMPHGVCFLWREDLVYLHLVSDVVITLAYLSLPLFLGIVLKNKPEWRRSGVVPLFALFILFCGMTHAFNIWVLFVPDYLAQGMVKVLAALVSLVTAVLVWPLLPKLIAMPTAAELIEVNKKLRQEMDERTKAEELNRRLMQAIEGLDEVVVLIDEDGRILKTNAAWRSLNGGMDESAFVGVKFEDHVRNAVYAGRVPDAIGREEEWIGRRLEHHRMPHSETDVPFIDGRTFQMKQKKFPDGTTIMVGGDVTKQRELEAAKQRTQRMESVGQLTGGIAHDFNNLLAIVIGNLDFLKIKIGDNTELLKHLESARRGAERGAELTRKLLSFSRQDATPDEAVSANSVIDSLKHILTRSLTSEIDAEFRLADDLWDAKADAGDLADVVLNLAVNSRDAMPNGGTFLVETKNIRFTPESLPKGLSLPAGDYVVLSATDNGCGIAKDLAEKVFEPFFSTKDKGKGTGLGLSMVYAFAKRSGGDVRLVSAPGTGTTVRLYLPRFTTEQEAPVTASKPIREQAAGKGTETILIVDDEQELADLAAMMLQGLGYRTLTACNGPDALDVLTKEPGIDLLFSDVVMPGGMDGFALAEEARRMYPRMPVVLASGFTGKLDDDRARNSVADTLMAKPYELSELAPTIRAALDSRQPGDSTATAKATEPNDQMPPALNNLVLGEQ